MKQRTLYEIPATGQFAMLVGKIRWKGLDGYTILTFSGERCRTMFLEEKASFQLKEAKLPAKKEAKIWDAFREYLERKL